ncbi:MAG: hypothetical protein LAT61_05715 [Alcanivorax sp.]|nr:hypothetical protein [Alcanivorax sp.]
MNISIKYLSEKKHSPDWLTDCRPRATSAQKWRRAEYACIAAVLLGITLAALSVDTLLIGLALFYGGLASAVALSFFALCLRRAGARAGIVLALLLLALPPLEAFLGPALLSPALLDLLQLLKL